MMSSINAQLINSHHPKNVLFRTVFETSLDPKQADAFQPYYEYCNEELQLLHKGLAQETWLSQVLAVTSFDDLSYLLQVLRRSQQCVRADIRRQLKTRFESASPTELDHSINLGIRLWLMLNIQERDFGTLRHQATFIEWGDDTPLDTFVQGLFPEACWDVKARTSRLGPYFTASFMRKVCGLKLEWTTSLVDHLHLDHHKGILRIFGFKDHLERLLEANQTGAGCPIPSSVLRETLLSLELLFPIWDPNTTSLLKEEKQTFQEHGTFTSQSRTLTLMDFDHWRDRLLELQEVLDSPPVSWAQLWRDRRNPQQFWTFWIALIILIITFLSFVASIIQAWASVKALRLAELQFAY